MRMYWVSSILNIKRVEIKYLKVIVVEIVNANWNIKRKQLFLIIVYKEYLRFLKLLNCQ